MRILPVSLLALLLAAVGASGATTLLAVDDGALMYDINGDCIGDSDTSRIAVALHHWHYSAPFAGVNEEIIGGFGCLGPPRTWTVTVPEGQSAEITGRIRYTWDIHVFPGGGNDVHLLVTDATGSVAYSTLVQQGPFPAVGSFIGPVTSPIGMLERPLSATLGPGTYTITEDVTSGAHTAWLTRLSVTLG